MSPLDFGIMVLACQRLTALWFEEVARPLRDRLIRRGGRIGYLARCPLCVSMWSAGTVVLVWLSPLSIVNTALAVSGAVICLDRVLTFPVATAIHELSRAVQRLALEAERSQKDS